MKRLTKEVSISKIGCAIATSAALSGMVASLLISESANAATLTLQEVTEAELSFSGSYGFPEYFVVPFTAVGSMKYQSTPIEGSFYAVPEDVIFLAGPDDLPEDAFPTRSFTITADQGYRLVTELNFSFPTSAFSAFSYTSNLTYGSEVDEVLFFRPPSSSSFPASDGALLQISNGDGRNRSLFVLNYWFFGGSNAQLLFNPSGSFFGFDDAPSSFQTVSVDGTWQITAVPEPFSILGTAAAVVGAAYLKRRQGR
ncbi:MAG TPA: PEP-CTERM sorting domain-containing protein [Leptolyngbyaceae cyanobacterium M33_DOE_097]|nr:PEP-CTERM sorting domain-containing protein [Leptolyngbyaceae cyanobacterium M33_DOE_097]